MIFLLIASYPDSLLRFRGPLIRALLRAGLTVHVAAPDLPTGSDVRHALEIQGVHVHTIPMRRTGLNPLHDLVTLVALRILMRKLAPRFVLGYTIKPVIYGSLAAASCGVPARFALITGLGYAFTNAGRGGLVSRAAQALYRHALSAVHTVFFQNPDDEILFRERSILSRATHSRVVNGSGVDLLEFSPVPVPSAPRFLLIARLLGNKGVREYAQAAARVREKHPEVGFMLAGWIDDGPDAIAQAELDAWIEHQDLEYLGRLRDVRPAIARCSVYVLPSYREGTPRTVLEAMAMGRAVITTDAPGCRETVVPGDNGFLVPVGAIPELEAAMLRFVEDPLLANTMGKRSRALAETRYDVDKVNDAMLAGMGITPSSALAEARPKRSPN